MNTSSSSPFSLRLPHWHLRPWDHGAPSWTVVLLLLVVVVEVPNPAAAVDEVGDVMGVA